MLVVGGYVVVLVLGVSGLLVMVVVGLVILVGCDVVFGEEICEYIESFWEMID